MADRGSTEQLVTVFDIALCIGGYMLDEAAAELVHSDERVDSVGPRLPMLFPQPLGFIAMLCNFVPRAAPQRARKCELRSDECPPRVALAIEVICHREPRRIVMGRRDD